MGVYDNVNISIECPNCKKEVTNFQTKDTNGWFETVDYWECDHFYSSCDYCNAWIDFDRKKPKPEVPLSDYEMKFVLSTRKESQLMRNHEGKIVGFTGGS